MFRSNILYYHQVRPFQLKPSVSYIRDEPSSLPSLVRSSTRTASSQVQLLWGTDSQGEVSPVNTILKSSRPGSTVIYATFLHNMSFPYKTTSFCNHLPWVLYRVNFSVKIYSIGIAMSFVFTRMKRGHGFILVFYYRNWDIYLFIGIPHTN